MVNNAIPYLQQRQITGKIHSERLTERLQNIFDQIFPQTFRDACIEFYTQYNSDPKFKTKKATTVLKKFITQTLGVQSSQKPEVEFKSNSLDIYVRNQPLILIKINFDMNRKLIIRFSTYHDTTLWITPLPSSDSHSERMFDITFIIDTTMDLGIRYNSIQLKLTYSSKTPKVELDIYTNEDNEETFIFTSYNTSAVYPTTGYEHHLQTRELIRMFNYILIPLNEVFKTYYRNQPNANLRLIVEHPTDSITNYMNWFRPEYDTMEKMADTFIQLYKDHKENQQNFKKRQRMGDETTSHEGRIQRPRLSSGGTRTMINPTDLSQLLNLLYCQLSKF